MGWNLPPGCTDKDIDDAAPQESQDMEIDDYIDMRREALWVERTLHEIEVLCDEMCGKGYDSALLERLNKIRQDHWPVLPHYVGEDSE